MIFYRLNPGLIVSELAGSGFVIYAPPEPTPCRLEKDLWLALDESKDQIQSKIDWNKCLSILDCECDFQELLDKR